MKILGLIFTIVISGQLLGQGPKVPPPKASQTGKVTESGWQYTRWGMTAGQIVTASKGTARIVSGDEQYGLSNELYYPESVRSGLWL